jgi:hypothetical protein
MFMIIFLLCSFLSLHSLPQLTQKLTRRTRSSMQLSIDPATVDTWDTEPSRKQTEQHKSRREPPQEFSGFLDPMCVLKILKHPPRAHKCGTKWQKVAQATRVHIYAFLYHILYHIYALLAGVLEVFCTRRNSLTTSSGIRVKWTRIPVCFF